MGYHLQDDDAGDYYSADIKTDPAYGTPVFDLIAGVSSCPPEPGTQSRDVPILPRRLVPEFNNLDINAPFFFIFL